MSLSPVPQSSPCPVDSGWGSRRSDKFSLKSCGCSRGTRAAGGAAPAAEARGLEEENEEDEGLRSLIPILTSSVCERDRCLRLLS